MVHTTPQSAAFYLGAKGTGRKFSKQVAAPPQGKPIPKDRKPDWVIKDKTTPEQAVMCVLPACDRYAF